MDISKHNKIYNIIYFFSSLPLSLIAAKHVTNSINKIHPKAKTTTMANSFSPPCLCFVFLAAALLFYHGFLGIEASLMVMERNVEALQQETTTPSQIHRTSFHFQPPMNWMNDPNGPMVYKGLYHLFYQYNPKGADWGNIVWAHSTSTDLVNWIPHVPAIFPSQDADINGCWSGSTTISPGGKPAILYTGKDLKYQQVQNLAVPKNLSDPLLLDWVKPPYNPLIAPTPLSQINASWFRDPTTAWLGRDEHWRVIIGNKIGSRGRAILYRSKDFIHWIKAKHPLHSARNTGMWECPDFYPVSSLKTGLDTSTNTGVGIKHVLKMSIDDTKHDQYVLGTYNRLDKFVPDVGAIETQDGLRYDYGKFYASKTFYDSLNKRRILWGWINESLSRDDYIRQGWSGIQGIPRLVWLDNSGKQLMQWPIQEIESLRENPVGFPGKHLKGRGSDMEIKGVNGAQADVVVSFQVFQLQQAEVWDQKWNDPQLLCSQKNAESKGAVGPFGLKVLASKDLKEYTAVFFRIFKRLDKFMVLMCSDQSRSSLNSYPYKTTYGTFLEVDPVRDGLSLRTLIDHSVVESFGGNGKGCITSRVYPATAVGDDAHLYVFNHGETDVKVSNFSAWSMRKAQIN